MGIFDGKVAIITGGGKAPECNKDVSAITGFTAGGSRSQTI